VKCAAVVVVTAAVIAVVVKVVVEVAAAAAVALVPLERWQCRKSGESKRVSDWCCGANGWNVN
jgi:hypothetical protein